MEGARGRRNRSVFHSMKRYQHTLIQWSGVGLIQKFLWRRLSLCSTNSSGTNVSISVPCNRTPLLFDPKRHLDWPAIVSIRQAAAAAAINRHKVFTQPDAKFMSLVRPLLFVWFHHTNDRDTTIDASWSVSMYRKTMTNVQMEKGPHRTLSVRPLFIFLYRWMRATCFYFWPMFWWWLWLYIKMDDLHPAALPATPRTIRVRIDLQWQICARTLSVRRKKELVIQVSFLCMWSDIGPVFSQFDVVDTTIAIDLPVTWLWPYN